MIDERFPSMTDRPPAGWALGSVTLTIDTPEPKKLPIAAWTRGAFAVHDRIGVGIREAVITHLPTGLRIYSFPTREICVECAEKLEPLTDWTAISKRQKSGSKLFPKVKEIVDEFEAAPILWDDRKSPMVSLYKRASPSQARILRAVEGAVKNAADAHGRAILPHNFARSVAKRAAGTLTAQWPDVLAANLSSPSGRSGAGISGAGRQRSTAYPSKPIGRGPSHVLRRSPLPALWKALAAQIRPLKESGQHDKAAAFVEVLKMIAALQRGSAAVTPAERETP